MGVFIDTQNLYHSARNLYKARVNFGAVLRDAVAGRKFLRAVAYVITTEAGDEKNFLRRLQSLALKQNKRFASFSQRNQKGDWDVGLTVDVMKMAPRLDAVIIISGDGDFIPLVEHLQNHTGTQVEIVSLVNLLPQIFARWQMI